MSNFNGHKLQPLNKRLNASQQLAREDRMKATGTWRQQMQIAISNVYESTNRAVGMIGTEFRRQQRNNQRINYALQAINAAGLIALAGRVLGYW